MINNKRLAKLILDQVEQGAHDADWTARDVEIADLLEQALTTARSRLDLRDRLYTGARDTNKYTPKDISEAISEILSDQIRDLDQEVTNLERAIIPSRLVMNTSVGLTGGALAAFAYGAADLATAGTLSAAMGLIFFGTQAYRKRVHVHMSKLTARRANYDSFRTLLRNGP